MVWGFCVYFVYMIPLETDVLRKHRFQKFKAVFFKISFIKTIIISNSLDEGQEQYSVWPDLDPNCLDSFLALKKLILYVYVHVPVC